MLNSLNSISALKERLILSKQRLLESNVSALQKKLYSELLDKVISILETDGGNIVNSEANQTKVAAVDKVFKEYQTNLADLMAQVATGYLEIFTANSDYFNQFGAPLFDKVTNTVETAMRARIGLTDSGALIKGGYLDSIIKDNNILNAVKQQVLSAVINGTPITTLTNNIQAFVQGTSELTGSVENYFRTYVYDTYSQFDRETSNVFSIELDLNYAIYAGGLVEHSRPFCIVRNGKVFTRDEISKFGTPEDKFGGYTNKSKGEFQGKNKNYVPERDMGGYNCGHTYNWVTYEIAKTIRPDIPKYNLAA